MDGVDKYEINKYKIGKYRYLAILERIINIAI